VSTYDEAVGLFNEGRLTAAIDALGAALRVHPEDRRSRTFLFELLCFQGDHDRATACLDALCALDSTMVEAGSGYRSALMAQRARRTAWDSDTPPAGGTLPVEGLLNGTRFHAISDADPRIGSKLETIIGGRYCLLPLVHLRKVQAEPPERLRDLFWIHASVWTGPELGDERLDVLLPAMAVGTEGSENEGVRLGRGTEWAVDRRGWDVCLGPKYLRCDDQEVPLLEVRSLEFESWSSVPSIDSRAEPGRA